MIKYLADQIIFFENRNTKIGAQIIPSEYFMNFIKLFYSPVTLFEIDDSEFEIQLVQKYNKKKIRNPKAFIADSKTTKTLGVLKEKNVPHSRVLEN